MATAEMVEAYVEDLLRELTGAEVKKNERGVFPYTASGLPVEVSLAQSPDGDDVFVSFDAIVLSQDKLVDLDLLEHANEWNRSSPLKFVVESGLDLKTKEPISSWVTASRWLLATDLNQSEFENAFRLFSLMPWDVAQYAEQIGAYSPLKPLDGGTPPPA
jgi:hypothetical protein